MKRLWAPWRMAYIHSRSKKGCFLCTTPSEKEDAKNLILYQSRYAFVVMNKFPYNTGHLMVAPRRHCHELEELSPKEAQELFDLLKASTQVLKAVLHAQGFNIGLNVGKAAGAGEEHLHLHVVPRWHGDTNFMPILSATKVVPQSLDETYEELRLAFRTLGRKTARREGGKKK